MADTSLLAEKIGENIGLLTPPKLPVQRVEYSIASVAVSVHDEKTLDLGLYVQGTEKEEYVSLEDYWADVRPVLKSNVPPWMKAKKAMEFRYAVASNDRTTLMVKDQECDTPQRNAVLQSLQMLIDHYASQPVVMPAFKRYIGRNDPQGNEFEKRLANQRVFLRDNSDALHSMIFSNKEQLKRIYDHGPKFVEEIMYSTELKGIRDGE